MKTGLIQCAIRQAGPVCLPGQFLIGAGSPPGIASFGRAGPNSMDDASMVVTESARRVRLPSCRVMRFKLSQGRN